MHSGGPPIRVALDAHVVGRRKTGNETYIVGLGGALAARPDVETVAYVDRGASWPDGNGAAPALRELRTRRPYLRIPLELPVRARRDRAELLHVQYVAPPVAGLPVVTTVHDVSFLDRPDLVSARTRLRLRSLVRRAVRRSAVVLTLSAFSRDRLLHHHDVDPARIVVTSAGVSGAWAPEPPDVVAARIARLGLPARFVLAVGDVHPRKNVARLVESVAIVRRRVPDVGLVITGQPAWRASDVARAVARVDGDGWVHFTGYQPADVLRALYQSAEVVAFPSLYEGFGLPVVEALALGRVVVTSNTTSLPEVAGDAALLVDPESTDSIAAGLELALTDDDLRRRLIDAGPRRAARFTWAACAEATVAGYRQALGRGHATG